MHLKEIIFYPDFMMKKAILSVPGKTRAAAKWELVCMVIFPPDV